MKQSIVILAGGGPAPGINTVVGTIAKTFISKGYNVLGLHEGYKGLFSTEPNVVKFDFFLADNIFNRGGSYLMMSRFKPSQEDFDKKFNLKFFEENNIISARSGLSSFTNSSGLIVARAVPEPFTKRNSSFLNEVFPPPASTYSELLPYLFDISARAASCLFNIFVPSLVLYLKAGMPHAKAWGLKLLT
ncbi:MAG: 6-phosphofructokinase [Bacteroidales bacterium]|nr:6-phosphofructokinase [Bacteroidales bacterium]